MEQPKKPKSKLRDQGQIKEYKEVDWIDKAMGTLTHPFTAFGYKARGEDLPNNFQKAENTNAYDEVVGVVNPARRFKSGVDAMESLGKGDMMGAILNTVGTFNPAKGAAPAIKSGTSRLTRNKNVVDFIEYSLGKLPKIDAGLDLLTGKDLAASREEILKTKKNKK